jgi:hypothetical protein
MPDVACEALEVLGRSVRLGDLEAAEAEFGRDLALVQGAVASATCTSTTALAVRDDPEPAAVAARRAAELARRHGLDQTLASALALEAQVHARAGRVSEMQRCIEQADALDPGSRQGRGRTRRRMAAHQRSTSPR